MRAFASEFLVLARSSRFTILSRKSSVTTSFAFYARSSRNSRSCTSVSSPCKATPEVNVKAMYSPRKSTSTPSLSSIGQTSSIGVEIDTNWCAWDSTVMAYYSIFWEQNADWFDVFQWKAKVFNGDAHESELEYYHVGAWCSCAFLQDNMNRFCHFYLLLKVSSRNVTRTSFKTLKKTGRWEILQTEFAKNRFTRNWLW